MDVEHASKDQHQKSFGLIQLKCLGSGVQMLHGRARDSFNLGARVNRLRVDEREREVRIVDQALNHSEARTDSMHWRERSTDSRDVQLLCQFLPLHLRYFVHKQGEECSSHGRLWGNVWMLQHLIAVTTTSLAQLSNYLMGWHMRVNLDENKNAHQQITSLSHKDLRKNKKAHQLHH